jgi:hypothetical protein
LFANQEGAGKSRHNQLRHKQQLLTASARKEHAVKNSLKRLPQLGFGFQNRVLALGGGGAVLVGGCIGFIEMVKMPVIHSVRARRIPVILSLQKNFTKLAIVI